MLFIPLPFCVAFALAVVLVRMVRQDPQSLRDHPRFALLIAAYTVQSLLIGLRWGYDIRAVLPAQAILASAIAGLAWASFASLTAEKSRLWPHLLPALLVGGSMMVWPDLVGPAIIAIFLGYGLRLLWQARLGPDGLAASRLDGALRSYRAMVLTAFALIGSAVTDILISIDLEQSGGAFSAAVIAGANLVALLLLATAAASVEPAPSLPETEDTTPIPVSGEDAEVADRIDRLMASERLFLDPELNLARIARRLHLPVRAVSQAINRQHGVSVSHYVNNLRIAEACRLLRDTEDPVTRIMFEAGFLTKSNFNREFQRVMQTNPTTWRKGNGR
ncbi:helix-turn-helix domain-containing protein [Lacibacterium aquatile]|uniref:Helix-turn-helix domain-containing protein n=1 Tax=Lacibacterium aquatile TaxID=1168082 RepID=A0ABW5DSP7_9PROT